MQNALNYLDQEHALGNRNLSAEEAFNKVNANKNIRDTFGKGLENQVRYLNSLPESTNAATKSIERFNQEQTKAGESTVKTTTLFQDFKSGLSSFGSTALSVAANVGTNILISSAIQGIASGIDYVSHAQERAIESGNNVIQNYKDIQEQAAQSSSWIDTNGDRYEQLSKGVSQLGGNLSLTNDEYAEYQQLSSQIAQQFPELVTGYDSLGKPVIGAAKSVDELKQALKDQKVDQFRDNVADAKDVVSKFSAEVDKDKNWFWEEAGSEQQVEALKKFKKAYNDAFGTEDKPKDSTFFDPESFIYDNNFMDAVKSAGVDMASVSEMFNQLNSTGGKLKRGSDAATTLTAIMGAQEDLEKQTEQSAAEFKSYLPAFFESQYPFQDLISEKSEIEGELTSLINSMTYDDLKNMGFTGDDAVKNIKAWTKDTISELQKSDVQDALDKVFTINDDSSEKSFKEWRKQADNALDDASSKTDAFTREQMRQASGIADQWQQLHDIQGKVSERWDDATGVKSRDLSIADLKTLGTMLSDSQYDGLSYDQMVSQISNVQETARLTLENMKQVVTDTATSYSSLSTAMSETMSSTGMTSDSITAVKTALSSLISENDSFKDANLDGLFRNTADGVEMNSKAVEQLVKQQHDMKVDDFTKSIKAQNKTLQEQKAIIDDNTKSQEEKTAATEKYNQALSDLAGIQQAQSQYNAQYQQIKDMFSDYNKWVLSQSADTAGTPYNNIVSGLEQAYKDFQKGLIGTESFKSFAAMISPTGATDPADFAENYAKASRYLQEGDKGVKAFLSDLQAHDLAEYNEQTKEWTINTHSAAEAAEALATGTDVASAAFGKLEDYGFHINNVEDTEDGLLKLQDKFTQLAEAKAKLKEMEDNPSDYSDVRIQAQKDEVELYTKDISDLTDNMQYYVQNQVEQYQQERNVAEETIKEMAKMQQDVINNPSKYGGVDNANSLSDYLTQQMEGYGSAYGIDAKSIQDKAIADAKAYAEALKNASIDNPATPNFGDDEQAATSYASALEKVKGATNEQKQALSDASKTLSQFTSEEIKGIDLFDGAYDSEKLKPAEQALDTLVQAFGLTNEEAAQLGVLLESIGMIKPETSALDASSDELTQMQQKLNELTGQTYEFNFDTTDLDQIQKQIDQAKEQLEQFKKDGQVDYSQEGAQEASDIYEATVRQQQNAEYDNASISQVGSTDSNTSQLLNSAKQFMQAKNELDVQTQLANEGAKNDVDTAQENAQKAYETFKQLNDASGNKLGIDTTDIQTTEEGLLGQSEKDLKVKVDADTSQAEESIAGLQNVSGSTVTLQCDVQNEDSFEQAKSTVETMPPSTTATVNMEVNGEADLQKATSLIESAPKNQDSELIVNCHVNNKEEYDSVMQAQDTANKGGANVKVNATIGEVDTSSVSTSATPVQVKGQLQSVEPYSGEAVEINAKANITGVVGGDNLNVVINAKAKVTGAEGQTSDGTINYKKGTVEKADGTTSEGIINYRKGDVEKADGTVSTGIINYDLGNVATPTGMVATGVINYTLGSVAKPNKASGTMTSIARANGTMHNAPWNYRPLSSAHAKGDVALKKNEQALVNEVGVESIVRDGQWSLIPGGAHLENLKKGDIIFSASQTKDLLERGATPGHARAYAQGTASNTPLFPAYVSGRGTFSQDQPYTNKTSVSSGSSSDTSSTQQHTSAVQDDTDATEDNTEATKDSIETFDWVKVKLDKFSKAVERISNRITDYISSALKTSLLKKQMSAINKEIKANQQGYQAYIDKANSIGISQDYKDKVINGTFSVEDIDTSTDSGKQLAKDVKNFQTYMNSAEDCKDKIQELNNTILELYETLVNMPLEKAEKSIDKLKSKYESLSSISDTTSLGGSAIAQLQSQINEDNPKLATAQKSVDKAQTARNKTKKTRSTASKTLQSAKTDVEKTGKSLVNASKKETNSIAKNLKSVAKKSTDNATYNAIAQAIREGKTVDTKGLKGATLKYAKSYNKSLTQTNTITSKVSRGKTVSTSGLSKSLTSKAKAYNKDNKEKDSAQKQYDTAKKADEKALEKLNNAERTKEKVYAASTTGQQVLATTSSTKSYVYQNMLLTQQTKNLKQQNKVNQNALKQTRDSYIKAQDRYDTAKAEKSKSQKKLLADKTVMASLNKTQKKALEAGKTISTKGISDPKVLKKVQEYNEKIKNAATLSEKLRIEQEALDKANQEASASQAEYAQAVIDNEKKKLENISTYYDSHMSQYENRNSLLNTYMDRVQSQGYNLSTEYYTAQIDQYEKQIAEKQQELSAMKRQFQKAVDNGTIVEGTEEYYEMQDSINEVAMSIEEATNNITDMQSAIRDLEWSQFDQLQDAIGRITSESDFLIDLMSHKDMYDEDGKMTDQGLATMGLHGVNYNTYMAQADKYKEEMLKISEELANDPNNQKLIDRKNELIDAQQQAILSAENEKDSIKDLIQDGIDKELDSLKDLIDKYTDALSKQKDLYEYQKKITEQSENIASLQKQLSSLQGDNSEENKAKLQKLKESLKDAQSDLEDTQYDRYISDQKELLDDLYNSYKDALDKRMDNVDALITDAIATINSNSSNIKTTLETETDKVGYTLSGDMQTIWAQENGVITQYGSDFSGKLTGVNTALGNIYTRQQDMINALGEMAKEYVDKVNTTLQQITKTPDKTDDNKTDTNTGNNTNTDNKTDTTTEEKDHHFDGALLWGDENENKTGTGNNKAEVGDKVTFVSGKYYAASDGTGRTGNYYLGKKVKITQINKGAKYPYCIDATDGTELGWVKLSQLKGYASGIMKVPEDQLAWTQEQGEEAIVRKDGGILTPLSRDMSVLNADMTKNLWDFMSNPGGFINDFGNSEKYGIKSEDNSVSVGDIKIECNLPNVQNPNDFVKELINNKDVEKALRAMTTGRAMGGSSLAKYKYRK